MAQVDFSHALLRPVSNIKPLEAGAYLNLKPSTVRLYNAERTVNLGDNLTADFLERAINKMVIVYSGEFAASGTEFYIGDPYQNFWRVSNISFSEGDMFSFKVTMEITSTS
jgi:hypothetical protein